MREGGQRSTRALRDSAAGLMLVCLCIAPGCDNPGDVSARGGVLWEVPAQSASTTPAVMDSVVVFGTLDGSAIAFDRQTGNLRWKQFLAQAEVYGEVEQAAGLALIPQYELWAVDPRDGHIAWHFGGPDGGAAVYGVSTSGDTVFTGSVSGWASALDARTGQPFWSVDLGEAPFEPAVTSDVVIYGTRGFLGASRQGPLGAGHVIALRRSDGSEVWRLALPDSAGFLGGAVNGGAVWKDRLIVGGVLGSVYALRLGDGAVLWDRANGESPAYASYRLPPAILDDLAVFARDDNTVEARDILTGEQRWTWDRGTAVTPPVARGSELYLMDGPITIAASDGTVFWEYGGLDQLGRGQSFFAGQVADDGTIYTLGVERLTGRDGTYVFAIRPPVKP